jgi:hypothetical protein
MSSPNRSRNGANPGHDEGPHRVPGSRCKPHPQWVNFRKGSSSPPETGAHAIGVARLSAELRPRCMNKIVPCKRSRTRHATGNRPASATQQDKKPSRTPQSDERLAHPPRQPLVSQQQPIRNDLDPGKEPRAFRNLWKSPKFPLTSRLISYIMLTKKSA